MLFSLIGDILPLHCFIISRSYNVEIKNCINLFVSHATFCDVFKDVVYLCNICAVFFACCLFFPFLRNNVFSIEIKLSIIMIVNN